MIVFLALYGYAALAWTLVRGLDRLVRHFDPTAPRWGSGTITGCPVLGIMRASDGRFVLMCWRRTLFVARAATPHPRETPE